MCINKINQSIWDDAINHFKDNDFEGTYWHSMGYTDDGLELCLVFGYEQGYDKNDAPFQINANGVIYTLCAKLAFNIDDLQCDYDVDWYEPSVVINGKCTGDIYDTNMAVNEYADVDYWNKNAENIIKLMNNGELYLYA